MRVLLVGAFIGLIVYLVFGDTWFRDKPWGLVVGLVAAVWLMGWSVLSERKGGHG